MSSPVSRLRSLDIVRGLACVLMAIDHVRVYSGLPAGGPTADIFLTRWVTHFVAPVFCLFVGIGAYLLGRRLNNNGELRRFLVSRGLLLVLLELTLIRFLWSGTVSPDFMLAGVIWMLGWCMVILAAVVSLKPRTAAIVGVLIVPLQPLFGLPGQFLPGPLAQWWTFIYPAGDAAFGINVLYVIVPWIGVMIAGYGFGAVFERDDAERRRSLLRLGLSLTVAFLVITPIVVALSGDAGDGPARPFWMRVLDQQKYPASPPFLAMTLGPAILLLLWAERAKGWFARVLDVFGRVPMWFYLWHVAIIHAAAMVVTRLRTGAFQSEWFATAPYTQVPDEGRWSLGLLYLVWALCIALLLPLCAWYAKRKAERPALWMRYL